MARQTQITKVKPVNFEEEARQIAELGDVHRVESDEDHQMLVKAEIDDMRRRHDEGENDAWMKDTLVGARLQQHFKHENHEARWARQHKAAIELDKVLDMMRQQPYGSVKFNELRDKKLSLEAQL